MCTAFSLIAGDHYFGRNLDLDYHYDEKVTITPRNYRFPFRHVPQPDKHYAIIGIGTVIDDYPLYYEGINEKGLCMAGLNFPGNAIYNQIKQNIDNIASFEFIPWVLQQCETVLQAMTMLEKINLCNDAFRADLPPTPLHWIIADRNSAITVEPTNHGLEIFENRIGVLTNNPPFSYHLHNLSNFMNLTVQEPVDRFGKNTNLQPYSLGMGAIGLPGDFSSASRFIRCAFIKENSLYGDTEDQRVSQAFHILDSVSQFDGCTETSHGYEKTLYSICCNATKGIFYYTTYNNRQILAIDLHQEDLNGHKPITYSLITKQQILYQN